MEHSYVVVTAYYNLAKNDPHYRSGQGRTHQQYLNHGRQLLTLGCPMIIFCEEDDVDTIKSMRSSAHYTKIISIPWQSLPKYRYFDSITERRGKHEGKYSGGYYMLVNSKVDFMLIAMKEISCNFFVWIDFGIAYLCNPHHAIVGWLREKLSKGIKFRNQWIKPLPSYQEMSSNLDHYLNKQGEPHAFTSAQCWMGDVETMTEFCTKVNLQFEVIMSSRDYVCLEEPIFSYVTAEMRSKCSPYIARYVNALSNMSSLRYDQDLYQQHIEVEPDKSVLGNLAEYALSSDYLTGDQKAKIAHTLINRGIDTEILRIFAQAYSIVNSDRNDIITLFAKGKLNR
jgi:hypothetical protein